MASRVRPFLTPLLINLAFAIPLRLVLPITPDDSGERHRYYQVSMVLPLPDCPSFHCVRIVPPLIASLLPWEVAEGLSRPLLKFSGGSGDIYATCSADTAIPSC